MTRSGEVPEHLLKAPFRLRDARSAGVSPGTLRGPTFRSPFHGTRVAADLDDTLDIRAAAALTALVAGSALSCHTAAQLRNLPVPRASAIHVDLPAGSRASRVRGIEAHVRTVKPVLVRGLPVSPPGETFLELAAHVSLTDLVVLGDALVRRGWATCEVLNLAVRRADRRRGVRLARRAVGLVRPRVDSPAETLVRLLLVLAGLPTPEPGYRVIVDGQVVGYVDMAYPQFRIVIEYDDLHRTLKKKWRLDIATREALRGAGWTVIVLTWDDYAVTPVRTVARVARALAHSGCADVRPSGWPTTARRNCLLTYDRGLRRGRWGTAGARRALGGHGTCELDTRGHWL